MVSIGFGAVFLALCAYAALRDIASMIIPNWLNALIALLFIPAAITAELGWALTGGHLLWAVGAFVLGYFLFLLRVFGGGDAKMIAAVLLWIGPAGGLAFIFGMAMIGGGLALVLMTARNWIPAGLAPEFMQPMLKEKAEIPYGVAIFGGALISASSSPLLERVLSLPNFIG